MTFISNNLHNQLYNQQIKISMDAGLTPTPPSTPLPSWQKGFSLIELMITIAIVAVLLTVALPSFNTAIKNNKIRTQANDLLTALSFAKSEAIRRGVNVRMCTSNTGLNGCYNNASKSWSSGWLVIAINDPDDFDDTDNNNDSNDADGDGIANEVLRVWDEANYVSDDTGTGSVKFIEYKPNGLRAPTPPGLVAPESIFNIFDANCTVTVSPIGRGTKTLTCP